MAIADLFPELEESSKVLGRFAENDQAFETVLEAFLKKDVDRVRKVLESLDLLPYCRIICRWICIWYCFRVCRILCREIPEREPSIPEIREYAQALARLTTNQDALQRLVNAVEHEDAEAFGAVVNEFNLGRFCYLLCHWVCVVRCRLFCKLLCSLPGDRPALDPLAELRETGEALAKLTASGQDFERALEAFQKGDADVLRGTLQIVDVRFCPLLCFWVCIWHCFRVCRIICKVIPLREISIPEFRELTSGVGRLGADPASLRRLVEAFQKADPEAFDIVLKQYGLRLCYFVCYWLCHVHCDLFCIIVCPPSCVAVFRYIGGYNYLTEIDSGPLGDGLTLADDRAFYSTIRLNGIQCKKVNGQPAEYRFEVRLLPAGGWVPVLGPQIAATKIGVWEHATADPMNPIETKDYVVNGTPGPDELALFPDAAAGWIQVPQESNVNAPEGSFIPNGDLIKLRTDQIASWPVIDMAGISAGQSAAPAGLGQDVYFSIRMRVREVGNLASEFTAGICQRLAIYNRLYDNVSKGGSWAPSLADNQLGVAMLNIQEIGGGCAEITHSLTANYTAAHPNLGSLGLTMTGPGGPYSFTFVDDGGATPPNRFGYATPNFMVSTLPACAYLVTFSINLLLTTGDSVPDPLYDIVAFCKQ
ncbi:MAG: hypothetical protein L0387_31070 [Acidobacteria bacterium]|nr:hypothetical protein [Acidobacteriota bacterium]